MLALLLAFLLRAGFDLACSPPGQPPRQLAFPDEQQYWQIARSLVYGGGFQDEQGNLAARMPGYPLFLAAATQAGGDYALHIARLAQAAVAAAGCAAGVILAVRLAGIAAGFLAGLLLACDPFGIFFSHLLLHETLAGCLLLLLVLASWPLLSPGAGRWHHWALAALCLVGCVYVNPALIGVPIGWGLLLGLGSAGRKRWLGAVALVVIPLLALVPWAVRNRLVLGEWVWLTTRGGISLYDGQGPQATGGSDLAAANALPEIQHLSETQQNRFFVQRSWEQMSADPARVLRLAAHKLARMWSPWLHAEGYRGPALQAISMGWSVPVYLLALLGVWRLRRQGWRLAILVLPVIYLSAVHMVFVGSVRYRVPIMPILDLWAGIGAIELWHWMRWRHSAGGRLAG